MTPVALVEQNNQRWLVGAFGEVNWVHNIRASGTAQLQRGSQSEMVEVETTEAASVPKQFLKNYGFVPFIPPYFKATATSPLADFEREASQHPVFLIIRK